MGRCAGSKCKGIMSLEPLLAMLVMLVVIISIQWFNPNLDSAVMYKEASDVSNVILITNSLGNPNTERVILENTNPNLYMYVEHSGIREVVKMSKHCKTKLTIVRPVFNGAMEDVAFHFCY